MWTWDDAAREFKSIPVRVGVTDGQTYQRLGHTVELIDPLPGLPDMVYAANGGIGALGADITDVRVSSRRGGVAEDVFHLDLPAVEGVDTVGLLLAEIGQGAHTSLAQIVGDVAALQVDHDRARGGQHRPPALQLLTRVDRRRRGVSEGGDG